MVSMGRLSKSTQQKKNIGRNTPVLITDGPRETRELNNMLETLQLTEVHTEAGEAAIADEMRRPPVELGPREVQDVQLDQHQREDVQAGVRGGHTLEEATVNMVVESYLAVPSPKANAIATKTCQVRLAMINSTHSAISRRMKEDPGIPAFTTLEIEVRTRRSLLTARDAPNTNTVKVKYQTRQNHQLMTSKMLVWMKKILDQRSRNSRDSTNLTNRAVRTINRHRRV